MINIKFDDYLYYPTLRTRVAELRGLRELSQDRKDKIVPLLTLGRWPRAEDFTRPAEKAIEAMDGRPVFFDLTTDANHLAEEQKNLRNPENGFEAWRVFISQFDSAIPVIQINRGAKVRDVVAQARMFEASKGRLAFRIRDFSHDTPYVINALSALDSPLNAIVFIDCQYIRDALSAFITAAITTINQIRVEFPEAIISVLATSFPASTIPFADQSGKRGVINILERVLYDQIGGNSIAIYGDHASIHSVVYDESGIMRWAVRVDAPQEREWYFERRPQDQSEQGYQNAAQEIVNSFPEMKVSDIWGEQKIVEAAAGAVHAKAPASWISVRVNIHLSKQIDAMYSGSGSYYDEELDEF